MLGRRSFGCVCLQFPASKHITEPYVCQFCEELSKQAIAEFNKHSDIMKDPSEETIFERLLTDSARRREKGKEAKQPTFQELADESTAILNAGTEPTATMMAYATYYFLRYPETQKRILEELEIVELDKNGRLPLQKLETLPYFVRQAPEPSHSQC